MHAYCGLAQQMCNSRSGIAPAAIDEPFVADRFVALDEATEEALHLRIVVNDRVEILGFPDHDFASDNRLDAIFGDAIARQNAFARKA